MSEFGDYTSDDAFDTAPADPGQVAMKLHAIRLREGLEHRHWEELSDARRARTVLVVEALMAWMRRQGAH